MGKTPQARAAASWESQGLPPGLTETWYVEVLQACAEDKFYFHDKCGLAEGLTRPGVPEGRWCVPRRCHHSRNTPLFTTPMLLLLSTSHECRGTGRRNTLQWFRSINHLIHPVHEIDFGDRVMAHYRGSLFMKNADGSNSQMSTNDLVRPKWITLSPSYITAVKGPLSKDARPLSWVQRLVIERFTSLDRMNVVRKNVK